MSGAGTLRTGRGGLSRVLRATVAVAVPVALTVALLVQISRAGERAAAAREANLESLTGVEEALRERHYDPAMAEVDWESLDAEFRPRVARARGRAESRAILSEMLSRFGDSHLTVLPAELFERREFVRQSGTVGLDLAVDGSEVWVDGVDPGSAAADAAIRRGWAVVAIEGRPTAEILVGIGEVPEVRRTLAATGALQSALAGPVGASREIELLDGDGETFARRLTLRQPAGELGATEGLPAAYDRIEVREEAPGVGYVGFRQFVHPAVVMRGYNEALRRFASHRGVVIDLRGNGGGMLEMVQGTLGWLAPERTVIGRMRTRDDELSIVVRPRIERYEGRVAVLVDGRCMSGAELFAQAIRTMGRGLVVGTRTSGSVLGGRLEPLANGDRLVYPAADFHAPDGRSLEGVGVEPHRRVRATREDALAGRDPVLESAVAWLLSDLPAPGADGVEPGTEARPGELEEALAEAPAHDARERGDPIFDPRAAEVLDAFVEATGGREAYAAVATRVSRGTVRLGEAAGPELRVTVRLARPDRGLSVQESAYYGRAVSGSAEGRAWSEDLMEGPRWLPSEAARGVLRSHDLDGLARWRESFREVRYLGVEEVGGADCHHLRLQTPWGAWEERWFALSDGLMVRSEEEAVLSLGRAAVTTTLDDYRGVGGVRLPFRARIEALGQLRIVELVEVEQNVDLDPGEFRPPAALQR